MLLHLQEDEKKAVCPVYYKPDYFGMIIGIAGGIVGVGMLTILLWKAFTTVTDRREFARWISRPSTTAVSPLPISMILQVRGGAADDEVELERQPDLPASHHHHPEPHVLQRFLSEI